MPHKTEQLYYVAEGWPRLSWLQRIRLIVIVHNARVKPRLIYVALGWAGFIAIHTFRGIRWDAFALVAFLGTCYYFILRRPRPRGRVEGNSQIQ